MINYKSPITVSGTKAQQLKVISADLENIMGFECVLTNEDYYTDATDSTGATYSLYYIHQIDTELYLIISSCNYITASYNDSQGTFGFVTNLSNFSGTETNLTYSTLRSYTTSYITHCFSIGSTSNAQNKNADTTYKYYDTTLNLLAYPTTTTYFDGNGYGRRKGVLFAKQNGSVIISTGINNIPSTYKFAPKTLTVKLSDKTIFNGYLGTPMFKYEVSNANHTVTIVEKLKYALSSTEDKPALGVYSNLFYSENMYTICPTYGTYQNSCNYLIGLEDGSVYFVIGTTFAVQVKAPTS